MQSPAIVSKEGSDQSNDINVDLDSVRSWIKTAGLGSHSDFFFKEIIQILCGLFDSSNP
jgi:hypothetical protein